MGDVARAGASGEAGAFGFLRLALAALVIVSHAPELLDGTRAREPLTQAFGTLSSGELAVDGFFLISGFLVTGSWLRTGDVRAYLRRRAARIFPGFLVAFALCVLVVAPLAGGSLARLGVAGLLLQPIAALAMMLPAVPGAFAHQPYPALNGAMWTISLELRCYLLVLLLGRAGVLRRPALLAALAAVCFAVHAVVPKELFGGDPPQPLVRLLVVDPYSFVRLAGHFIMGAAWLQLWPRGRASARGVAVSATGLVIGLSSAALAEPAVALFGGYLLFAASRTRLAWLRRVGERVDISYGVYLYAWPVINLLILYVPGIGPGALTLLTLAGSAACGWASWNCVEAPAIRAARRSTKPSPHPGKPALA